MLKSKVFMYSEGQVATQYKYVVKIVNYLSKISKISGVMFSKTMAGR